MLPSESNGYRPGSMPYFDESGELHVGNLDDVGYDDDDDEYDDTRTDDWWYDDDDDEYDGFDDDEEDEDIEW